MDKIVDKLCDQLGWSWDRAQEVASMMVTGTTVEGVHALEDEDFVSLARSCARIADEVKEIDRNDR